MQRRTIKEIFYTSHFARALKMLKNPPLEIFRERESAFRANCFHPTLRTHKLTGKLQDHWSFSLTQSHRVLFTFLDTHTVVFIDIGDHSIYT